MYISMLSLHHYYNDLVRIRFKSFKICEDRALLPTNKLHSTLERDNFPDKTKRKKNNKETKKNITSALFFKHNLQIHSHWSALAASANQIDAGVRCVGKECLGQIERFPLIFPASNFRDVERNTASRAENIRWATPIPNKTLNVIVSCKKQFQQNCSSKNVAGTET